MFVLDRGPARHFHGRNLERGNFLDARREAAASSCGTTFLIQGPPGAGKTALLHKLSEDARQDGWQVIRFRRGGLTDPADMARQLGVNNESKMGRHIGSNMDLVTAVTTRTFGGISLTKRMLAAVAGKKKGLLLVLDEAQNIADLKGHLAAKATLDLIHNGEVGRPVILLAGGLGKTVDALASLGITRYWHGCQNELGRLESDASCRVIRDWLKKSGDATGDVTAWVKTISQESADWPHHIINYADPAARWLRENGRLLTDAGLDHVLTVGRQGKEEYCRHRAAALGYKDQALLGALIRIFGKERQWNHDELIDVFGRLKRAPGKTAGHVINLALAKGVLSGHDGLYHVPVASMENWLVGRFEQLRQRRPDIHGIIEDAVRPMMPPRRTDSP